MAAQVTKYVEQGSEYACSVEQMHIFAFSICAPVTHMRDENDVHTLMCQLAFLADMSVVTCETSHF